MEKKTFKKFIVAVIGVVLLCLAPLGFLFLAHTLSVVMIANEVGIGFVSVLGFILGIPLTVIGVNYLLDGDSSALSQTWARFDKAETNRIKQLEEEQRKLMEQMKPKRTRRTKKDEYKAEAWKEQ